MVLNSTIPLCIYTFPITGLYPHWSYPVEVVSVNSTRSLVVIFLILALCGCCLPAGAILQEFNFRGSVLGFSEANNTVTILATHQWRCEFDSDGPTCTWKPIMPQVLTGTAPVPEVFDRITTGSQVMAGSLGMPGGTWTGLGLLTPPYGPEPLLSTDLYGDTGLLPAPLVAGYGMSATLQPDCDACSGSICQAVSANLTIFRDGAEVWNGVLLPGEDTQYRDPSDQSGLYVKFVSGETSSHLCPNATGGIGGPQPISIFVVHVDRPGSGPRPPIPDRPGSLIIFSVPAGATVFLDGEEKGAAPITLTGLAAGPVSIRAEKEGYAPWEKEVTVFPGARLLVTARLEPLYGSLRIQSFPSGADIILDGQDQGTTPLVISGLDAGAHSLLAEKTGYRPYEREVTVIPGREISLYLRLSPEGSGLPVPL